MGSSLQSKPNRSTLLIRKQPDPNKGNNNNNNNYLAAQIDFRKIDKPPQPNLPLLPCRVASLALSRPSLRSIQTCTPSNVGDGITAVPSIRLYRIRHRPDPTRPWTYARTPTQHNATQRMQCTPAFRIRIRTRRAPFFFSPSHPSSFYLIRLVSCRDSRQA